MPESWGFSFPKSSAAPGADYLSYALAIEELARVDAGTAVTVSVHSMICSAIRKLGTQRQKERWLPRLASGDAIAGFALTESDAGSDAAAIRATANRTAGGYVVRWKKAVVYYRKLRRRHHGNVSHRRSRRARR